MKKSNYHPEWQNSRINFILNIYGKDFFKDKRILELAPCNGYIGYSFQQLQAQVTSIEGRSENIIYIKHNYPEIDVIQADLDTSEWEFGEWDIIINFGLLYHLQNHHEQHLINCIKNSKLIFLESVIFDSYEPEIYYRNENGFDQSLSGISGTPSARWVEDILQQQNCNYAKYIDCRLNGGNHIYNWRDTNSKIYNFYNRRFWIISNS